MKSIVATLSFLFAAFTAFAQSKLPALTDLDAPKSPGFQLVDISPANIEAPSTPKSFVLGILQTFDANIGWPQNYSMETSPYMWMKTGRRDAYRFFGFERPSADTDDNKPVRQHPFSALKFSSFSASFISKDLIPDETETAQKVFSGGFRSKVIRIYQAKHIKRVLDKMSDWSSWKDPLKLS